MRSLCFAALVALVSTLASAQTATIEDLQAAIMRAEADAGQRREPGMPSVADVNLPLARLKLKKARLIDEGRAFGAAATVTDEILEAARLIEMAERGELYRPERGRLTELAYVTRNDGTVQPYYVHLPENYTSDRPWPMIVFLHGYVDTISVVQPWVLTEDVCDIAERNGCILVLPYGRRNTDFQGVGEVDVFRVIEEMRRLFNVDPARLYLSGVSMGGMGTWNIALRNPGTFAAVTPISGQTNMFRWWAWDPADMTPFKRFLVRWDNPEEMVLNGRGQHFFAQHGELDHLISVVETRSMVEKLREAAVDVRYHEFAGEGHYIYWYTQCFENAWTWVRDYTLDPSPRRVSMRCFSLNYNRAFWLTIEQLERWGTPAEVDAQVSDDGTILTVKADNTAALTIDLDDCPLERQDDGYRVVVNDQRRLMEPADGLLRIPVGETPEADGWLPLKRKGLCGPAEDVFNTRFVVVQGTSGGPVADRRLARQVGTWADEWDEFADGYPRVMTDTEVTDEEIARSNLVLFGTPATNSVLARIADRLPITISDHRYEILGRTFEGDRLGLVLCYPNPLQPDRYVLIYSGELYGRELSANHKHDMLPDFLIFDSSRISIGGTEANVFGGWFDVDWKPREDLAWEGVPGPTTRPQALPLQQQDHEAQQGEAQ